MHLNDDRQQCRRLMEAGDYQEAAQRFFRLLENSPDDVESWHNLGFALLNAGLADQALTVYQKARQLAPHLEALLVSLMMAGWNTRTQSAAENADLHRQWARDFCPPALHLTLRPPNSVIRLGYVSSNFTADPEHAFLHGPLLHHDRRRFRVYCYSSTSRPDRHTNLLRQTADVWREIRALTDPRAAQLIARDRIDILIDCSGHFRHTRLGIFAHRPAHVQVSFPTYPAATGLPTMDYRLTDAAADPDGDGAPETLHRLPHSALCYRPLPPVKTTRLKKGGALTFGCLQRRSKITNEALAAWTRILHSTPGSQLIVQYAHSTGVLRGLERWRAQTGLDEARIRLIGRLPLRARRRLLSELDLVLDTFPYNGTATTCEALCLGIPVLTLAGDSFVSRMGASLLKAARLDGFTAATLEEYEQLAIGANLQSLRKTQAYLRTTIQQSPLADAASYTADLEAAYLAMLTAKRPCGHRDRPHD